MIDTEVLRDLESAGVRPGLFTLEAQINLQDWIAKRDVIMDDIVRSSGGMLPYCFPMTADNNSQTILQPTAKSLLDLTNLTGAEKRKAHLHPAVFANAEVMVSMGSVLYKDNVCFTPTILFGRNWQHEVPMQPHLGASVVDNNLCSAINVTNKTGLQYETAFNGKFHFDGRVYGCSKST